ncbi:MAG TPA: hypothetical protein VNA16_07605, partial [Abditibacteriaceae bacterium]|nr:hypothetical protein [Abditibacteriaceae bacterium]
TVRMPTEGGLTGLRMLESWTEWTQRRRNIVQSLKLGAPPKLDAIKIGTWAQLNTYRVWAGPATRERAELDFQNFADLGINSASVSGVSDALFAEFAGKYHITDTTLTVWASNWAYTNEAYNKQYDYLPGETVPAHWTRVFDDYYRKTAESLKKNSPFAFSIATHLNLGDEIGAATNAEAVRKTPQLLSYFRAWLAAQGKTDKTWTPAFFGAKSWDEIEPLDDRRKIEGASPSVTDLRRFYWTWRFINSYTSLYYKAATDAARKYFPHAGIIVANYQAGPAQNGYLGNNNDMNNGNLDIFQLGHEAAFQGAMLEDWVGSSDVGAGFVCFGADVIRAAARKPNGPLAAYLVGHNPRSRFYAWLMQGVKEIGLYLYGPITNIGPAWAEHRETLQQIAQCAREVKKFEPQIAAARLRPTKTALLMANTSEIMQARGLYFPMERQHLYIALRHSGIAVDIISEQDIADDNILKEYSLLFVTDPQVRSGVQRKIATWVQQGGRLWAGAGAMNWDEYSQPSAILHPVFGVSKNEMVVQPGGFDWARPFYATAVGKLNFTPQGKIRVTATEVTRAGEITAWGMRSMITPTTGRVLGAYEDGKPALVLHPYGKGAALLVGALMGEAYVREHWPLDATAEKQTFAAGTKERELIMALAARAGVAAPVRLSVPGIYTSVMEAPGATLIFLNNASGRALDKVNVQLAGAGKVRAVESIKGEKVTYRLVKGQLSVETPLADADVLRISH